MIPRSYLFVPGDRPDRYAKGLASGADVVMLDLEDAVAADAKDRARESVATWLRDHTETHRGVYVRVNDFRTPWFVDDCALLTLPGVIGAVLPKADQSDDIQAIRAHMPARMPLVAMVETAVGIMNLRAVAATPGVSRLAFGTYDLQFDLGISGDDEELLYARSLTVLASRAAGIQPPIDGVVTALDDLTPVIASVQRARRLGFRAKLCVHPRQVATVNEGFLPDAREVTWARRVLAAVEANPVGALRVDGQMVDRPVIDRARAILDQVPPERRGE